MNVLIGLRYFWFEFFVEGEVIEVVEGVFWIWLFLLMVLDYVNVYVLDDGDSWIIVDIGFVFKCLCVIWEKVFVGLLVGKFVCWVIVIYYYFDYVGLVGWFQFEYGVMFWIICIVWLFLCMLQLDEQVVFV